MSNEKRAFGYLLVYRGWNNPQLYRDYFIYFIVRIPSSTKQYFMESMGPRVFFVAHVGCRNQTLFWGFLQSHPIIQNHLNSNSEILGLAEVLKVFALENHQNPQALWRYCIYTYTVPTKTQLSNFLGTPGEDYFKGNPKSLNFYFLVIWWGKYIYI